MQIITDRISKSSITNADTAKFRSAGASAHEVVGV